MRSRGGASSSGFRAGVFGRPASAELFGLIAEMTSMRAFSESGPADRLEPSPSLRRRLRRSPGERGRRRPPSSLYDGAVAQPAKRGVRRMGQLSAFLPLRVRSMYWRETVSMIPSTACAPHFFLDGLPEAGDVVHMASLLGEHDQRAIGGDLMILIGITGVEVLQRFVLRQRMNGCADASRKVGHGLLNGRRVLAHVPKGLLKTFKLPARDHDVILQQAHVLRIVSSPLIWLSICWRPWLSSACVLRSAPAYSVLASVVMTKSYCWTAVGQRHEPGPVPNASMYPDLCGAY
jgi:hypothetical protein